MSEENVEILRGIFSEMARGNFWALAPYLDADVGGGRDRPSGGDPHGPDCGGRSPAPRGET
jgi:hypothetical protein